MQELRQKLQEVFNNDSVRKEVIEYFKFRLEDLESIEKPINLKVPSVLRLHARYSRSQILSAISVNTLNSRVVSQSGIYRITEIGMETELLFVTLYKGDGRFSSRTMYNDYFINSEMFHWQSQNSTAPDSIIGQGYINQDSKGKEILLFVREATKDQNGVTMAYVFCGRVHYISHEGRKPMSIIWRMENAPPAMLLSEGRKLAVG